MTSSPDHDPVEDPTASTNAADPTDPVILRRRQITRYLAIAVRIGYVMYGLFLVLILVGFVTHFPSGLTTVATICLVAGTVILAPAMTFTYAVKAADREDREGDWR